jgi:DNA-binding PadR family transcriptional regulator
MHGYQLHETIETHLGHSVQLKKPTLYKLLNTLHEEGWLDATEAAGQRQQTRRVYNITDTGKAEFIALLKRSLSDYHPTDFTDHVAIAYLDYLPVDDVKPLLEARREKLVALLDDTHALPAHAGSLHLFIDHQRHHLQSEIAWLDGVIQQYSAKDV